jgi:hypothetical protein
LFRERGKPALKPVRDITFGIDQKTTRQPDDPFVWRTPSGGRQFGNRNICDVDADYGEIAVLEFPNIRTHPASGAWKTIFGRFRSDSAEEFNFLVHMRQQLVN